MKTKSYPPLLPAQREQLNRLALDSSLDAIAITDESGRVLDWNRRAEELFDWSLEEAVGKLLPDVILPERLRRAHLADLDLFLMTGQAPLLQHRMELPVLRRDGTEFHAELTVAASRIGERLIFCSFIRDITLQKWVAQRNQVQNAITAILARSPAVEDAIPALLSAVCDKTPWIWGAFWSVAEEDSTLSCTHLTATDSQAVEPFRHRTLSLRLRIGQGLPGRVWESGKPEWIEDIAAESNFIRASEAEQAGLRTAFAFPVRLNDRFFGGFEFFSRQGHPADPEFHELVQSLSCQLSQYLGRKRAEEMLAREREELKREREKYASLISSIDSIVWEADPKTWRFTFVSPQAERLLGYPVSRWLTEDSFWQDHIHPQDWDYAVSFCAENIRKRSPTYHFDYRMTAKDGRILWFRDYVTLVLEGDEVVNLRGILVDITHIKESEQRFRKMADHAPALLWITGQDAKCTFLNKPWLEYTGRTLEQDVGDGWSESLHPDDLERCMELYLAHFRERKPFRMEYRLRRAEGSYGWVLDQGTPQYDPQGNFEGYIGSCVDITEWKKAEMEVAKFALLVEESNDFIAMADFEGRCLYVNKAGQRLVGMESPDEREGKLITDYLLPEDREEAGRIIQEVMARGHWQGEFRLRHFRTGKPIPVWWNLFFLKHQVTGAPVALATVTRDLTQIREKEDRLRQAQKMEAVGRLAGGIAHDFNNLLTAINGYGDLLVGSLSQEDPNREYAAEIKRAGERAASLTQQLLTYSRKQEVQKRTLSLNETLIGMEPMLRRLIGENIELRVTLSSDPWTISMDPGQVEQIVMNLCLNARDALPKGGRLALETSNVELKEDFFLTHLTGRLGPHVLLSVLDTGEGMSRDTLSHLFEPFFTTKEQGQGTGLGLSTVYGIVKQAEGSLDVESGMGQGTVFKVYLPALPDEQVFESTPPPATAGTKSARETLLLVEDEEIVRNYLCKVLEAEDYVVLEASNGEEALTVQKRHRGFISLLISDVIMPKMGGVDLARDMRRLHPEIRVLLVSGYTANTVVTQDFTEGEIEFLGKPFSAQTFLGKVDKLLQGVSRR